MAERRRYPDTGVRPTVDPQQTSPNDAHRCQAEPTEQEEVIMSEPFIFINSFEIKEGKLEDLRQFLGEFLTVVESNEPRLLALNAYVNEDGTEVTFVQVHPDAASLEHHQRVAHEHTRRSRQFLGAITSIQVYGTPNDVILKKGKTTRTIGGLRDREARAPQRVHPPPGNPGASRAGGPGNVRAAT
jgi:hypothetical protein